MIKVDNGRIFVEGKETTDPTLIGYALIDAVEQGNVIICTDKDIDEIIQTAFNAGVTAGQIIESVGSKLKP